MEYKDWLAYQSRLQKKDVSRDEEDYDLPNYFKSLKYNPGEAGPFDPDASSAHLTDTFKKPNHKTFSDESMYHVPVIQHGGHWEDNSFTPSELNTKNLPLGAMQSYFNNYEPKPEDLNVPGSDLQSKARKAAIKKLLE